MIPDKLIIFDGECNFCNSSVNQIIRLDVKEQFFYTPYTSQVALEVIRKYNLGNRIESILFLSDGKVFSKSDAILKIVAGMGGLNKIISYFITFIIPKFIRDKAYIFVANNRYRIMGKSTKSCIIPSQNLKKRFINE